MLDDLGRSDFNRLHTRARRKGWYEGADLVVYCVFDVLVARGKDLRGAALEARKATLARMMHRPVPGMLEVTATDDGGWLYQSAIALELEGVVGKRLRSIYRDGKRSPDWFKLKRQGAVPPERFKR